jgi:hypothetical protein
MAEQRASLLFVSGDPGGISSLAPVIDAAENIADISLWLHDDSLKAYTPRHPLLAALDADAIRTLAPDLVITGTSMSPDSDDKRAIRLAVEAGIPCVAFVDFWSNYEERFADKTGALRLPDCIAAIDETACEDMATLGFPEDMLVAIGPLRLEGLPAPDEDRKGILFISQCLEEAYGGRAACRARFGYCPEDAFHSLHAANNPEIPLAVRFHPREKPFALPPGVEDWSGGEASAALARSQLVAGMTGSMLMDAYFMGLPVVSIQPGMVGEDALMLSRRGFIPHCDSAGALEDALPDLITSTPEIAPELASWSDGQAVERFITLIRRLIA